MGSHLEKRTTEEECDGIDEGDIKDEFQVDVKSTTGETHTFTVTKKVSVKKLMAQYIKRAEINICPNSLHFIHKGKRLDPSKTLGDYNIGYGEVIHKFIRMTGC